LAKNGVVGRDYISNGANIKGAKDSKGMLVRINSLDVSFGEVHYTLFSNKTSDKYSEREEVGSFGSPIKDFALFERVGSGTSLFKKVFPA
jgi:hypothetical protein